MLFVSVWFGHNLCAMFARRFAPAAKLRSLCLCSSDQALSCTSIILACLPAYAANNSFWRLLAVNTTEQKLCHIRCAPRHCLPSL